MKNCFVHHFPGRQIELKLISSDENLPEIELAADILEVFEELENVVQPLTADLQLGYCDREFLFVDQQLDLEPEFPVWHLRTNDIPIDLKIEPGFVNPQITEVKELSKKTMMKWIEKALQQECPYAQTHRICWDTIYIWSVRANIFDESLFKENQSLKLDSKLKTYELPFEWRNDGVWVYNCKDLKTQFPFTFMLSHEGQVLSITISVHWSLWTESGSPEHTALSQAISRIIAKGWEVNSFMEFFKA